MNIFKKIIFIIPLFFLLISPSIVFSQQPPLLLQPPLPGVNCGVAGDYSAEQQSQPGLYPTVNPARCCPTAPANELLDKFLSTDINQNNNVNNTIGAVGRLIQGIPLFGWIAQSIGDGVNQAQTAYRELKQFQKDNPGKSCVFGEPDKNPSDPSCTCVSKEQSTANRSLAQLCNTFLSSSKNNELGSCISCAAGGGVWTTLGCIPTNIQGFISTFLLSTGIGLGGIVALICIIYAAFQIQTSRGNPEKIKKAQELLTSCIMGLMLIIFSVFILRLIGINILRIPFLQ